MEFLSQYWMPILLSSVLVWIASAITHTILPIHKGDFSGLPDEGKVLAALQGVPSGNYMFPWGTSADSKNPEFIEKQKKGPVGILTVFGGPVNMGKNLLLTLLFYVLVGIFVAYLASHALAPGAPYLKVFQVAGTAAFLVYGLGWMPRVIWFKDGGFWGYLFDGVVFAGVTAGTFGWLWNH